MATTKKKTTKAKPEAKAKPKLVKQPVGLKKAVEVKKPNGKKKAVVDTIPAPSDEKQTIIAQFAVKQGDTGSPEVQVALLSQRIEKLVGHLKTNPSDNHSRRGLLGIVSKRRRLLNYLEKKNTKRFKDIAQKLGLSK